MKPIFAIDITNDKNNTTANGSEFIIRSLKKDTADKLQSSEDKIDDIKEKTKLPLWLRIIKIACEFVGLVFLVGIIRGAGNVGLSQGYKNAPYLFWICGACLAVWGAISLLGRAKEKEVLETSGAENAIDTFQANQEDALSELNVPANAPCLDFLLFKYKEKNGRILPQAPGFMPTPYINMGLRVFLENGNLCVADLESVYAFPLSDLKAIKAVKKRISVMGWNKNEAPTQGKYKPYKMTVNNMGCIFMKPYYAIELDHDGNAYEIYFPCYELPAFEAYTKLNAEK